jgi:3-oxoacyl-[acyl-carrier-protein] synthase II
VVHDPRYVQPSRVPNLVLNVPASHAAIRHGIRGSCITLTDGPTSGLKALSLALGQLASGRMDLALCGTAEEATPAAALAVEAEARRARCAPATLLEGAAMLALEPRAQARLRQRRMLAEVHGCVHRFAPGAPGQALASCLERLRLTQSSRLREISRLYLDGPVDGADWPALQPRRIAQAFEGPALAAGTLGAGMALVEFAASDAIGSGELGLLLHADPQGNAAAALLQRL